MGAYSKLAQDFESKFDKIEDKVIGVKSVFINK
jgi:hypothetical protein